MAWEVVAEKEKWELVEPSPARKAMEEPKEISALPREEMLRMEAFEHPTISPEVAGGYIGPMLEAARGVGEAALTVGGGFIDLSYIGWHTMVELARGKSLNEAMESAETSPAKPSLGLRAIVGLVGEAPEVVPQEHYWRVKESYIPESEEGREVLEVVGKGFEAIRSAALVAGEQVPEPQPIINIDPDAQRLIHDLAKTAVASVTEGAFYVLMGLVGRGALRKPRITRANIVEARDTAKIDKLSEISKEIDRALTKKPKEAVPYILEKAVKKPEIPELVVEDLLFQGTVHPSLKGTYATDLPKMAAKFAEDIQAIGAPSPSKVGEGVVRVYDKKSVSHKFITTNEYVIDKNAKPIAVITPKEARTNLVEAVKRKLEPSDFLKTVGKEDLRSIIEKPTPKPPTKKTALEKILEEPKVEAKPKVVPPKPTPEATADVAREISVRTITMEEIKAEGAGMAERFKKSGDLGKLYEEFQELSTRYIENPEYKFGSVSEKMDYGDWGDAGLEKINLARRKAGLEEIPERKGPLRSVTKEGEEILFEDPTDAGGFTTREAADIYRRTMKLEGEVIENPNMPGQFVIKRTETLDMFGLQSMYEATAEKLSKMFRRGEGVTTTEAIRRRDKQRWFTTPEELAKIRAIAKERGVSAEDLDAIAKSIFEKKHVMLLDREEVELIKLSLLERERTPLLESFRIVQETEGVKPRAKRRLERRIKVYDVDDIELKDLIDLFKEGDTLTTKEVNSVSRAIRLQNEIRPYDVPTFNSIAPIKRILGEKFMAPVRKALVAFYEASEPDITVGHNMFRGLNRRSRRAISEYREGLWKRGQLSPEELKANDALQVAYDKLWYKFGLDEKMKEGDLVYVKKYSPRRTATHEDQVNWAFSRRGAKEFSFWAEEKRTGTLWERETDAKALYMAYVRAGHARTHFNNALEALGYEKLPDRKTLTIKKDSVVGQMAPERQRFATKWIDTVLRKKPTADEAAIDPLLRSLMRRAGITVRGNPRLYKSLMSTMLSLNYASYMGLRPKLGIRNSLQQWLIINEYNLPSYLAGRAGRFFPEVRNAMKNSDLIKLRKRSYAVFEDRIMGMRDIPGSVRDKLMIFYRAADIDNVKVAFATGYLKAKRAGLPEAGRIRAGEKAITNTQWGYGVDLPYIFKSPTGKALGQYSSWFIWYADHLSRIITERHGAKVARTALQGTILYYLADKYGIDYTRTFLFGVVPKRVGGYLGAMIMNTARVLIAVGAQDPTQIKSSVRRLVTETVGGQVPGYLLGKDVARAVEEQRPEEVFIYRQKEKGGKEGEFGEFGEFGAL